MAQKLLEMLGIRTPSFELVLEPMNSSRMYQND